VHTRANVQHTACRISHMGTNRVSTTPDIILKCFHNGRNDIVKRCGQQDVSSACARHPPCHAPSSSSESNWSTKLFGSLMVMCPTVSSVRGPSNSHLQLFAVLHLLGTRLLRNVCWNKCFLLNGNGYCQGQSLKLSSSLTLLRSSNKSISICAIMCALQSATNSSIIVCSSLLNLAPIPNGESSSCFMSNV